MKYENFQEAQNISFSETSTGEFYKVTLSKEGDVKSKIQKKIWLKKNKMKHQRKGSMDSAEDRMRSH